MKILVFAHQMEVGGTQVNAIDLTAALRDVHGHDVVMFATPGPMVQVAIDKGLRFLAAPYAPVRPSAKCMRALREIVRRERPDVVHVWDWWQCLDAYYAVCLPMRIPMVVTDMMMSLTRILPTSVPTTFGTPELVEKAKMAGRRRVELLPPPVDTGLNAPHSVDPLPFCQQFGIRKADINVVTVSRLEQWIKSESLLGTVDAIGRLGRELPLRLFIVGEGGLRSQLEILAREVNNRLGRSAVVLTGGLLDPRPAYAAADIFIGMGGSALRAMAFAKPVIVVGEEGFASTFSPETADAFYYKGIFGRGSGDTGGIGAQLMQFVDDPKRIAVLGQFSRQFVLRHFSLETICSRLSQLLCNAATEVIPLRSAAADGLRTAVLYLRERKFLWRCSPPPEIQSSHL